jgi:hypothetical protein
MSNGIQKVKLNNSVYLARETFNTTDDIGIFDTSNVNRLGELLGDSVSGIVGAFAYISSEISDNNVNISTSLSTEISHRASADVVLSTNIDEAISGGNSLISVEESARIAGDNSLTSDLSTELVARASADADLSTNLSTELVARASADDDLSAALSTELVVRFNAVAAEESARIAAVSAEASSRLEVDQKLTQLVTGISMGETQLSSLTSLLDIYETAPHDVIQGVVINQNTTNTILSVLHDLLPDASTNYSLPIEISVYTSV